jgi:hypothetical protein
MEGFLNKALINIILCSFAFKLVLKSTHKRLPNKRYTTYNIGEIDSSYWKCLEHVNMKHVRKIGLKSSSKYFLYTLESYSNLFEW